MCVFCLICSVLFLFVLCLLKLLQVYVEGALNKFYILRLLSLNVIKMSWFLVMREGPKVCKVMSASDELVKAFK